MSSLENRGNGSWRLTISDGYASDGKKIRFQRTIHVDPMPTPGSTPTAAPPTRFPARWRKPEKRDPPPSFGGFSMRKKGSSPQNSPQSSL